MISTAPLHNRQANEPIAWLNAPLACIGAPTGTVLTKDFMGHVQALSKVLPEKKHAINLCENRYLFLVSLCACVLRKQTNLMPSNKNLVSQEMLADDYEETYIIHDGVTELAELTQLNLGDCDLDPGTPTSGGEITQGNVRPQISLDQVAAICFTSGSTGKPKPNIKTWRTLIESTEINSRYMLPNQQEIFFHLATVPGQHMWGFETSVLMALFAKVCMVDARPSFPHDVANLVNRIPEPKTIITTPLQLRALTSSTVDLKPLASVLCATAPLSSKLAHEVELKFGTTVREVYGCSEVGSMAIRQTSKTELWEKFDGLDFKILETGKVLVSAAHLVSSIELEDTLEMHEDNTFNLRGRVSDQIKIAGKRGSLHEVNRVLSAFPGLLDGVVFFPEQDKAIPRLVAIVSLEKGIEKHSLRKHFQKHLDSAFVPRPILIVPELPRETSGKLVKTRLLDLYRSLLIKTDK
jgi:acyl-coenzyme A synthetase/AMP-(fatty) acid ligase